MPEEIVEEQPQVRFLEKLKIHKFKILGGVLGVLVFTGAVFGAYKFGQRQAQPGPKPTPTPVVVATPTPLPSEAPAKEGDPTASWKTYTSPDNKFSIRHPDNWGLWGNLMEKTPPNPLKEWLAFKDNEENQNPQCSGCLKIISQKETVINGMDTIIQEVSSHPAGRNMRAYIQQKGTIVAFISGFPIGQNDPDKPFTNETLQQFDLMLSTFKFLE